MYGLEVRNIQTSDDSGYKEKHCSYTHGLQLPCPHEHAKQQARCSPGVVHSSRLQEVKPCRFFLTNSCNPLVNWWKFQRLCPKYHFYFWFFSLRKPKLDYKGWIPLLCWFTFSWSYECTSATSPCKEWYLTQAVPWQWYPCLSGWDSDTWRYKHTSLTSFWMW